MKLTKPAVDKAIHPPSGQTFIWDDELKGFGLRLTATKKTYIVQRRVGAKTVRVTIGAHNVFTPAQARQIASIELGKLSTGIHTNELKRTAKTKSVTLGEAFAQYKKDKSFTANTLRGYEVAYKAGFKEWDGKQIVSINRSMIDAKFLELSEKSKSQANLAFRLLRALLNYSMEKFSTQESGESIPLIPSNPTNRLTILKMWHKLEPRTGHIAPDQLKPWFAALSSSQTDTTHRATVKDFCAFVLLTGCREQEAARLKWSDVDLKKKTVTFTVTKNKKKHKLPIGDWLASMLARRTAANALPYVFPAENESGHLKNHRDDVKALNVSSGVKFTLHDLRRTFATIVNHRLAKNFTHSTIKKLLNHSAGDVTNNYIQILPEDLREPMCLIEQFVLRHAGLIPTAEVVNIANSKPIAA